MIVEMSRLGRVFGDRVLVRRLGRPEKMRGLLVPASHLKDKQKEQQMWYGVIEKFGLDCRYKEAYDLQEGDIVGLNDIGLSNAYFIGDDEQEHYWVMEEFLVCKDAGRISAYREDRRWDSTQAGVIPLGGYSVVRPNAEEDKRNGVFLPAQSVSDSVVGRVMATSVGLLRDSHLVPLNVIPSSDVLYGKYSGISASFHDEKLVFIKEEDMIAEFTPSEVSSLELVHG